MKLIKLTVFRFSKKVDRFINPTMAESFGEKLQAKISDKYLNPYGFLKETEFEEYDGVGANKNDFEEVALQNKSQVVQKEEIKNETVSESSNTQQTNGSDEYGFKIKGLEPTRFGDWERKGRCFDF